MVNIILWIEKFNNPVKLARPWIVLATRVRFLAPCSSGYSWVMLKRFGFKIAGQKNLRKTQELNNWSQMFPPQLSLLLCSRMAQKTFRSSLHRKNIYTNCKKLKHKSQHQIIKNKNWSHLYLAILYFNPQMQNIP